MEKVRPWCGQLSDRGQLKNKTEQNTSPVAAVRLPRVVDCIKVTLFYGQRNFDTEDYPGKPY